MIWIVLILAWLVSPIILLCLFISKSGENKHLREENRLLRERLDAVLRDRGMETPKPQENTVPAAEQVQDNTVSQNKPAETLYNMPQNNSPAAEQVTDNNVQQNKPAETAYNMPYYNAAPQNKPAETPHNMPQYDTVSRPAVKAEKKSVSTINIMLILGALFIIISGLIFATTTWEFLSSGIRAVVIFFFAAVFFGISSVAERKLKLPKTGMLFYTLGSVFLPITLVAAGYFKVFGEYLSLTGGGRFILLAATFALLAAVCIKGGCDYKSKAFSWCGLFSVSAAVCCIILHFTEDAAIFALAASLYSFGMLFLCAFLGKKTSERFGTLLSLLKPFGAINSVVLSISGLAAVFSGSRGLALAACVIFACGYLKASFTENNAFGGAVPFTVFLTLGLFAAVSPDDISGVAFTFVAVSAVPAVLSFMNIIPAKLKNAMGIISAVCGGFTLLFCVISAFAAEPSIILLAAYIVLTAEILLLAKLNKSKIMLRIFPAVCIITAILAARLIFSGGDIIYILLTVTAAAAVLQSVFVLIKKAAIRTGLSDLTFAFAAGVTATVTAFEQRYSNDIIPLLTVLIAVAAIILPAVFCDDKWKKPFFSAAAMIFGGVLAVPLDYLLWIPTEYIILAVTALLAVPAVLYTIFGKDKNTDIAVSLSMRAIAAINLIIMAVRDVNLFGILCIIAAVGLVRAFVKRSKAEFAVGLSLVYFAAGNAAQLAFAELTFERSLFFICGAAVVGYILSMFLHGDKNGFIRLTNIISRYFMFAVSTGWLLILGAELGTAADMVFTALFLLMTFTAFYNERVSVPLLLPLTVLYPVITDIMENYFMEHDMFTIHRQSGTFLTDESHLPIVTAIAAVMLLTVLPGFILHRHKLWEKRDGAYMLDVFAVSRFSGLFTYMNYADSDITKWCTIWVAAMSVITLCKKDTKPTMRRILLTITVFAPFLAWICQPFLELPDIISLELKILPVLIYCGVLRLIWRDSLKTVDNITFWVYAASYVVLFIAAISSADLADGLIIVISAFILLVFSFIVKQKKWFILSLTVIVTATLIMSRSFWASLAWWGYLLAAGLILIAIGAANELKKQAASRENKSDIEQKITRFMSEWTW